MHERQQDTVSYVRLYGHPDLFITATTNPNWTEITDSLLPGQHPADRPDIVARIFRLKVLKLMEMLKCEMVFGKVQAWLYSIEWQKRGLPHCHILLWLVAEHRITPDKTDDVIGAEIPDYNDDPTLYQIVISNMVHGPCGSFNHLSPCMKNGKCTKNYSKQFRSETLLDTNGYPLYRRRSPESGGQTATIRVRRQCNYTDQEIDNKWIVPYNKLLLRSMNCNCNVELCMALDQLSMYLNMYIKVVIKLCINCKPISQGK